VAALQDTFLAGLATNQAFLIDLLTDRAFREGGTFTHTVDEWLPHWKQSPACAEAPPAVLIAAALAGPAAAGVRLSAGGTHSGDAFSPWQRRDSWRV
jgi:acetyl/propionyl-CoA carboxylase alpha subunit